MYHTYSGIVFDHCQYRVKAVQERPSGDLLRCSARRATAWTRLRRPRNCRSLEIGDLVYSENIGAYSNASATWFNGFAPAQVVHLNQ